MRCVILAALCVTHSLAAQERSGVVFLDRNANGIRDASERGIPNVAVSDQDTVVLTDRGGNYRLPAGRGHGMVSVSVPDGYRARGSFWRQTPDTASFALATMSRIPTFRFIHASDTHISEQSLSRTRAFRALADSIKPAFVLITGDLVRDALRVREEEAMGYYELFIRERNLFAAPVYTVPGNHEIFGIETDRSRVSPTHPLFGKVMYRSYLGPDYYSFTYGGVHFVGLNSVDVYETSYHGGLDSLQLAWLARDLAVIPLDMPVVTFNHIPFYTLGEQRNGFDSASVAPTLIKVRGVTQFRHTVANATAVLAALAKRPHVLALGGHIHSAERIDFGWDGIPTRFRNAAAIVGPVNSAGRVFPSGFTVYTVKNGVIDDGTFVRVP
jgi:calcineurin-like phosphoesterase family protein